MTPRTLLEKQAITDSFRDSMSSFGDYASESFSRVPPFGVRPAILTAGLGSVLTGLYLQRRLNNKLKKLRRASKKDHKKILRHFKLDDLPVLKYPQLDNAAYVEQSGFHPGLLSAGMHVDDPIIAKAIKKNPELLDRMRERGLIIYDGKFNNPAILAHEAGHADMGNLPKMAPSRINQSYLRRVSDVASQFLAPVAGGAVGVLTRNPFLGLGAGALTGALVNAPTLINEYQATNRANRYLDKNMTAAKERQKSKDTLGAAFNTYVAGSAVPAAIMGGIGGLFSSNWLNTK